ncbi:MAG TPA: tetratricopeptide repeat protein, partial [Chthoniobacter sp.]|nr:tetratricopeptide repeat protein [Chthoniobacter sp.]
MPFDSRFPSAIVCLAMSSLAAGQAMAQAPAAATRDQQMMLDAQALSEAGKYAEAAAKYEELIKAFPQVPSIPEAYFRAGYAYYLGGNYDEALRSFKKIADNPNLAPEFATIKELSLSMSPQVLVAKAAKMDVNDKARTVVLEDAVKQFDAYLAKYPTSDEVESANYSKAMALYQLEKFDPSMVVLRDNMKKFVASPTMQDSQYLLALTLATVASKEMQKPTPDVKSADGQFDEGESLLRDIIAKNQNIPLINDSQFQVGELLLARGGFLRTKEEEQKRDAIFVKALDSYRSVASKDRVVAAQKARIAYFKDLMVKAGQAKDTAGFQKYKRISEKETEKLAIIEAKTDQTLTAKFKTGLVFFTQGKMDETRVLFTHLEQLGALEGDEEKKQALYFVTMSYAAQVVVEKAETKYKEFQATYSGDPIAQNLQLIMGAMFLNPDSKFKNPDKAIEYFKEGLKLYPKSSSYGALVVALGGALIELKRYDEALAELDKVKQTKPPKELAVDVDFYYATALVLMGKTNESVDAFKAVRETYPGTQQAQDAHAQVAQLLLTVDPKQAVGECESFRKQFPQSRDVPVVMMAQGRALAATSKPAEALTLLKQLATDYPKSDPAPFTYFERSKILAEQQKFDECLAVMKEFITQYPDSPTLFQAYDFMAQILTSQGKGQEAIKVYDDFVAKRPKEAGAADALLKLSGLWKGYTESQGNYIVIEEAKRIEWRKGIEKSTEAAERLLKDFPEGTQVALVLNNLMEVQRLLVIGKLKTDADLEKYFQDLAQKFSGQPGTQAKVLFTLASFTFTKDKAKAVEQMKGVYNPDLKFAPEDLDLFGEALIDGGEIDEAIQVYEKINKDNP